MTANTVASRKNKGRKFQHEIADLIRSTFDLPDTDVVGRSMGAGGSDIVLSERALSKFPFAIECKRSETKCDIKSWWIQASANANSSENIEPLLVFRANREDAYVLATDTLLKNTGIKRKLAILNKTKFVRWNLGVWYAVASDNAVLKKKIPAISLKHNKKRVIFLTFKDFLSVYTDNYTKY
jgi:hypothetical protein